MDDTTPEFQREKREADKKKRANEDNIKRLEEEQPKQVDHVKKVREYLVSIRAQFFGSVTNHADTVQVLLQVRMLAVLHMTSTRMENVLIAWCCVLVQHCVLPRATMSPSDALFTAKFFLLLHTINTPFFSTISYIDRVLRQLTPTVLCSSRREAMCLGIFLLETLTTFARWCESKQVYEKEVRWCR